MKKILCVAAREFRATVITKGFVIGMLFTPILLAIAVFAMPRMMTNAPPKIEGQVAIVDPTGVLKDTLAGYLTAERFAERQDRTRAQIDRATPEAVKKQLQTNPAGQAMMRQSVEAALGQVPRLTVVSLPEGTDVEQAKAPLKAALPKNGGDPGTRLMLVVVHPNAVKRADPSQPFGTYSLFVRGKLDDRLVGSVVDGMREAIVGARMKESGLDAKAMRDLTNVPRPESVAVTEKGERATNDAANILIPMGFMMLLMMSVMTSGNSLLTTTVEEKSNRVVEVLLSAVSAMELMTGKILGQLAVGFLVLAVYAGLGLVTLFSFASLGLLDPLLIVYLIIFYLLASFTYSAIMAAIGSAVNEMREAQQLMMPVMMVIMIPWMLWLPISRDPNSMLATVLSFVPALGNFVMLLRLTSTAPPPMWQPWLAIAIGAAGVYGALWFASKVFRVGLLMFGKPPTFGTLVKWARMP